MARTPRSEPVTTPDAEPTPIQIGDVNQPLVPYQEKRDDRWVPLNPPFEGARLHLWCNFPRKLFLQMMKAGTDPLGSLEAFRKIVIEHDGWTDAEGTLIPPVTEDEFFESISQDLNNAIFDKLREVFDGKLDFRKLPSVR